MIDQTFSAKNLLYLTSKIDPRKYHLGKNRAEYLLTFEVISNAVLDDSFKFSSFSRSIRAKKPVFSVTNRTDEFVIRKLNDNIRRIYNVKQANRGEIIGQIIPLVKEKVPFHLIKLDIKEFYESITRTALLEHVAKDSSLAYRSKRLLHLFFSSPEFRSHRGLPRGVSLSATLSEIYMGNFDNFAHSLDGVYFYARYVDDIIIMSFNDPENIKSELAKKLPGGMIFNSEKEKILSFNKNGNCINFKDTPEIAYLGYRFIFREQGTMPTPNPAKGMPLPLIVPRVTVKIAQSKISKLKRRIMLSIFAFFRNNDFSLLLDRFKFLTGNCQMRRDSDSGRLLSGIYYNYSLIDQSGIDDLKELTLFLRRAVLSKKGQFGKNIQSKLTQAQRRELLGFSFESGFEKRITHKIAPKRLQEIKACWHHV